MKIRQKQDRKVVWVESSVYEELKSLSSVEENKITLYSLVNDLLVYGLKNIDYDLETGRIRKYEIND